MEFLDEERELDSRYSQASGLEVVLVWNCLLNMSYSKVHDHKSDEQFNAMAPKDIHPRQTFDHPFIYRVGQVAEAVGLEVVASEGKGDE